MLKQAKTTPVLNKQSKELIHKINMIMKKKKAEDCIKTKESTNVKEIENSFTRNYEKDFFCIYVIIQDEDDEENIDDEDNEDDRE